MVTFVRSARYGRSLPIAASWAMAALLLFTACGYLLGGRFTALDPTILSWIRLRTGDHGGMIALARDVTALGNTLTLWVVTLLAAGYLAMARRGRSFVQLVVTTGLGGTATSVIKTIVNRPRPDIVARLVEVHSPSFPSGHAMNSAFVYATLAVIAAQGVSTDRKRRYLFAAAFALIVAIGTSRIVLGVHWPSDVLAGWTIGLGWAGIAAWLFDARGSTRRA